MAFCFQRLRHETAFVFPFLGVICAGCRAKSAASHTNRSYRFVAQHGVAQTCCVRKDMTANCGADPGKGRGRRHQPQGKAAGKAENRQGQRGIRSIMRVGASIRAIPVPATTSKRWHRWRSLRRGSQAASSWAGACAPPKATQELPRQSSIAQPRRPD